MKRTRQKNIRLTSEEEKLLRKKCFDLGITESEFFRSLVNDYMPNTNLNKEINKLTYEIRKIGININQIANNILNCINNTSNGGVEVQLDSLSNTSQSKSLKLNIFLGDATKGTIYTNIEPLEIYIANYFENEEIYYQKILDSMTITKDNVLIKSKIVNKELLKQKIRERN